MAPVWNEHASDRGVVGEGAVGSRRLGRLRMFRYEIRRWRGGRIPDIEEAVDSPQRLTEDPVVARRVLDLVPSVPTLVWGRDELHTGDMWNSNSVTAWLLARAGIDPRLVAVPAGGRAPGWTAGCDPGAWRSTPAPAPAPSTTAAAPSSASSRPRTRSTASGTRPAPRSAAFPARASGPRPGRRWRAR